MIGSYTLERWAVLTGVIVDSVTKTRGDAGAAGGRDKARVMVLREKKVQVRRGRIRHSNIRVGLITREVVGGGIEVELAFDGHGRTARCVGGEEGKKVK
ncbi:hypothetical protein PISMIDRAFT_164300 [Pisolithus microcarpus 441]|uniref:Uncharacterized protein n=1 Tax=Pisolithus microcarpus 441 TaxID=765257 RepID=A0A0C9ZEA5_9AGAM|nr:hypothetical protein PISMIDRAFT_164300 [Pisolithus microcarpus 441]